MSAVVRSLETRRPVDAAVCAYCGTTLVTLYGPASLCFDCWTADRAVKRETRRLQLHAHLSAGGEVLQAGSTWPKCSPWTPEYAADWRRMADHLEAREYGFGFPTTLL